jgi:hypothetical protein
VGYSDSSKAYRIYIPEQHKIEVSRDVTFNEKMAFKKSIEETIEEEEIEELNEEAQKTKMTKRNYLIILWSHVKTLIQISYLRPRKDQLGLKLPYKMQKDSRFQKEHSERVKDLKDSQVMQHT